MHYQPFRLAHLMNDVIFAAPVIKLEPHELAFPVAATISVGLDKHKHPDDKVVVLHVIEKEGKRHWEDVTEKSIFKEDENAVLIELAYFSFLEILFVKSWVQVKHILTKLKCIPIEYKLSVFGKHDLKRHPYSDLKLVFMSSDVYSLAAYREDNDNSIAQLKKEGFEEIPCDVIPSLPDKKAVYNEEEIEITLSLGRDMKLITPPETEAKRSVKVDSSIWRGTGCTVHFRLESMEEVKMFSGKIEVRGVLTDHHLEAKFCEEDFSGYLKKILSLESIANLMPVARRLEIEGRWREVASEWENDENQVDKILSIWQQKNASEDPCKIKELVGDIPTTEHLVSERGKLHVQHVRHLANKIEQLDKIDKDCIRCFNKEFKHLILFLLGDCCIEICADEEEIDECFSSQEFVRLLLKKEKLAVDFAKQLQQVIDADLEEMDPQEFSSVVAPLIQLVKENYKEFTKSEEPSGLWGLSATFVEQSKKRVKDGVQKLKRGKIVTEVSRILEEMCLLNRKEKSCEQEIKCWGACAGITILLKELDFFLQSDQGLKLKKRIEGVAKCVREILNEDDASRADLSTVKYYEELAFSLLKFANFDPRNLVQFKIEPSNRVSSISRGLKYNKTDNSSYFSELFEITKDAADEVDLNVCAHVNIERHRFKVGGFQAAKVKLNQEERDQVEQLGTKNQFLGVATTTKEQSSETIAILCSGRRENIHKVVEISKEEMPNLNPGRVEHCPLIIRSCTNDRFLQLKLLYKKGEDVIRMESSDFKACAEPDESAIQTLPETATGADVSRSGIRSGIENVRDLIRVVHGEVLERGALVLADSGNIVQSAMGSRHPNCNIAVYNFNANQNTHTTTVNSQSNYETNIHGGNVAVGDQSAVKSETRLESED